MWTSLALVAVLAVGAPEVSVETLDGTTTTGQLTALSADSLTLQTQDGDKSIPVKELLIVVPQDTPKQESAGPIWVEFSDGSKITADTFTVEKGTARIGLEKGEDGASVSVPTKQLKLVLFGASGTSQKAWPAAEAGDLIAVKKKDAVDYLEGVAGNITADSVEFTFQDETIPVKRARVVGIRYFQPPRESRSTAPCIVESARGWKIKGKPVELADGTLTFETAAKQKFSIPINQITRLDFTAGKITYLSDLEPESVEWTPLIDFGKSATALAEYYAPRKDQAREQRPITIDGKQYSKGLALYSRTTMTYRLPAGSTRFKAVAGIDDAVGDGGHVRLQISADDKKLFDAPIAGKDGPTSIDLDVAGARRLSILVDYGDDLDAADHLDLADARIVK